MENLIWLNEMIMHIYKIQRSLKPVKIWNIHPLIKVIFDQQLGARPKTSMSSIMLRNLVILRSFFFFVITSTDFFSRRSISAINLSLTDRDRRWWFDMMRLASSYNINVKMLVINANMNYGPGQPTL